MDTKKTVTKKATKKATKKSPTTLVGIYEAVKGAPNGEALVKQLKMKRNRGITRIHAGKEEGTKIHTLLAHKFGATHVTEVKEVKGGKVFFKVS